jgi:hypothetical protein
VGPETPCLPIQVETTGSLAYQLSWDWTCVLGMGRRACGLIIVVLLRILRILRDRGKGWVGVGEGLIGVDVCMYVGVGMEGEGSSGDGGC